MSIESFPFSSFPRCIRRRWFLKGATFRALHPAPAWRPSPALCSGSSVAGISLRFRRLRRACGPAQNRRPLSPRWSTTLRRRRITRTHRAFRASDTPRAVERRPASLWRHVSTYHLKPNNEKIYALRRARMGFQLYGARILACPLLKFYVTILKIFS